MKLNEIAERLYISKYPEELNSVFENLTEENSRLCNLQYLLSLKEKYGILKDRFDLLIAGAEDLKNQPDRFLWARLAVEYNRTHTLFEARQFPLPTSDESLGADMLPLLVLLCEVPEMVKNCEKRGITDEYLKEILSTFDTSLNLCEVLTGRPTVAPHYSWLLLYTRVQIFRHKAFNFQIASWMQNAVYLRNKKSGEVIPMMTDGTAHRSGLLLGSAGLEDTEGSYKLTFAETPEVFVGHLVKDTRIQKKPSILKKSEWERILQKGDDVISIHIPRSVNFSADYITESLCEGFELTKKFFPEYNPRFIFCSSWLLGSSLPEILGADSKITAFNSRFIKIPLKSNGRSYFNFVFPGHQNTPSIDLPEDTRLQRKFKEIILSGGFIYDAAGIIATL